MIAEARVEAAVRVQAHIDDCSTLPLASDDETGDDDLAVGLQRDLARQVWFSVTGTTTLPSESPSPLKVESTEPSAL